MIGIGKFGSMYLAQVPNTPGVEVVGVADLSTSQAKSNLLQVGWQGERLSVHSLVDAISLGKTYVTDDWEALIEHPEIDVIVKSTGSPTDAVDNILAAFDRGKHVVNVTVEADSFCGPLLAKKASSPGVVYSLAFGDQPAMICDILEWARVSGFSVSATGKGHKWLPHFCRSTPDTVW